MYKHEVCRTTEKRRYGLKKRSSEKIQKAANELATIFPVLTLAEDNWCAIDFVHKRIETHNRGIDRKVRRKKDPQRHEYDKRQAHKRTLQKVLLDIEEQDRAFLCDRYGDPDAKVSEYDDEDEEDKEEGEDVQIGKKGIGKKVLDRTAPMHIRKKGRVPLLKTPQAVGVQQTAQEEESDEEDEEGSDEEDEEDEEEEAAPLPPPPPHPFKKIKKIVKPTPQTPIKAPTINKKKTPTPTLPRTSSSVPESRQEQGRSTIKKKRPVTAKEQPRPQQAPPQQTPPQQAPAQQAPEQQATPQQPTLQRVPAAEKNKRRQPAQEVAVPVPKKKRVTPSDQTPRNQWGFDEDGLDKEGKDILGFNRDGVNAAGQELIELPDDILELLWCRVTAMMQEGVYVRLPSPLNVPEYLEALGFDIAAVAKEISLDSSPATYTP